MVKNNQTIYGTVWGAISLLKSPLPSLGLEVYLTVKYDQSLMLTRIFVDNIGK